MWYRTNNKNQSIMYLYLCQVGFFRLRCSHLISSCSAKTPCTHQCRQWGQLNVGSIAIFISYSDDEKRLELRIMSSLWPLELWFGLILKCPLMALFYWLYSNGFKAIDPGTWNTVLEKRKTLYTGGAVLFQVTLSLSWQQSAVGQNSPYIFLGRTITLPFDTFCN